MEPPPATTCPASSLVAAPVQAEPANGTLAEAEPAEVEPGAAESAEAHPTAAESAEAHPAEIETAEPALAETSIGEAEPRNEQLPQAAVLPPSATSSSDIDDFDDDSAPEQQVCNAECFWLSFCSITYLLNI
jgi:hypothetical protein